MRHLWVVAVLSSGCFGLPGLGGPMATVTCAKSSNSCRCENRTFSLSSDESTTPSCESVSNATCCYDLDSMNETTSCDCQEYACYEVSGGCECGTWRISGPPSGATKVSSCAARLGTRTCCYGAGYGCTCQDYTGTPFQCAGGSHPVDTCPGASEYFTGVCTGKKTASSCAGLTWKP